MVFYTASKECVPLSVDFRVIWIHVRKTFPGMEDSIMIERLLDTLVTRMKLAERIAEAGA